MSKRRRVKVGEADGKREEQQNQIYEEVNGWVENQANRERTLKEMIEDHIGCDCFTDIGRKLLALAEEYDNTDPVLMLEQKIETFPEAGAVGPRHMASATQIKNLIRERDDLYRQAKELTSKESERRSIYQAADRKFLVGVSQIDRHTQLVLNELDKAEQRVKDKKRVGT